jgi:RNA binding exosome subunit
MIHYISLRVSAQATEDPEKVRSAIGLFLPPAEDLLQSLVLVDQFLV